MSVLVRISNEPSFFLVGPSVAPSLLTAAAKRTAPANYLTTSQRCPLPLPTAATTATLPAAGNACYAVEASPEVAPDLEWYQPALPLTYAGLAPLLAQPVAEQALCFE